MFKRTGLTFSHKRLEHDDVCSFYFKADSTVHHVAGQHAVFILPGAVRPHVFSLASTPRDEFVMIGTHVRAASRYKRRLDGMRKGNRALMIGPILNFTLEAAPANAVLLAQGIGITPFRSMLLAPHTTNLTLLHVEPGIHTYRSEVESAAPGQCHFVASRADFQSALDDIISRQPEARYYISGTPSSNSATKKFLRERHITRTKTDAFWGY